MNRTSFTRLALCAFALATLIGCGGKDGGDSPDAAAPGIDAAPVSGIGLTCTLAGPGEQSDCPIGYECVNLSSSTNPWCTQRCLNQNESNGECLTDTGYPGPGLVGCFFGIASEGVNLCGVVCQAPSDECPTCDGTCPGSQVCTPDSSQPGVSFCL